MRLLIVSYYFPPAAGGGVQRVLKWAKYLPDFGVEVHVLAPDDPRWIDSGGGLELPPGAVVHRTRNLSPRSLRPSEALARARGPLGRLARRAALAPRRLLVPDIHVGWSLHAVPAGQRVVREHGIDAVLSTSPPKTAHVIAARVALRVRVPWVADLRDSWLDLPHLRLERAGVRAKQALDRRIARRTVGRASAITTVSEPLAGDLRQRHPGVPVHVITNGVDLADVERAAPRADELRAADLRSRDRFLVLYTGNFFGRQSPQVLLAGLELALSQRPELYDRMLVRLVGGMKPTDHARIEAHKGLSQVVERLPFLDYADVLAWQRAADLLLLYVAPGRGSQGVYTGKVFEYVAARRPVLAMVPDDNVAAQLVRDAGAGRVVNPDDASAIARAIVGAFDQWAEHGRGTTDPPATVLARISRRAQAAELATLLQGLV